VPLSEHEQRILQEIEQQFYATDPAFAREVGSIYRHAFRNLKWAALGFVVSFGLLLYLLVATNFWVAFAVGFLPMIAAALWFEHNVRKLGRAGFQQVATSMRASGLRDALGSTRSKLRERFRRGDS
jgi:hypothetical protein